MEIESWRVSSYGSSHRVALTRWQKGRKRGSETSKFTKVNNQTIQLSSQKSTIKQSN